MVKMHNPSVLAEVLRRGNLRAWQRAARKDLTGVRLLLIAAALDLGILDALGGSGPSPLRETRGLGRPWDGSRCGGQTAGRIARRRRQRGCPRRRAAELDEEDWDLMLDMNLKDV